jgi:Flp pilus assembly protein TadD
MIEGSAQASGSFSRTRPAQCGQPMTQVINDFLEAGREAALRHAWRDAEARMLLGPAYRGQGDEDGAREEFTAA